MLKAVPFTEYMKDLRKKYNKESKVKPSEYTFKTKRLQELEDMYRTKTKAIDTKEYLISRLSEKEYFFAFVYLDRF